MTIWMHPDLESQYPHLLMLKMQTNWTLTRRTKFLFWRNRIKKFISTSEVEIMRPIVLKESIRVSDRGTASNAVSIFFWAVKWRDSICPIHDMSLQASSNSAFHVLVKMMLFVQIGELNGHVYFGCSVQPFCSTTRQYFVHWKNFQWIFPNLTPLRCYLISLRHNYLEIHATARPVGREPYIFGDRDHYKRPDWRKVRTSLFLVVKCIAILSSTEPPVPVETSRTRLIYTPLHPNAMPNRIVLPGSGIVKAVPYGSIPRQITNIAKTSPHWRKES